MLAWNPNELYSHIEFDDDNVLIVIVNKEEEM